MWCTQLAGNAGAKNSPSGHHRTTLSGYIFAIKAHIDNQKKIVKQQYISSTCLHNTANFGPLKAEIDLPVSGTPANLASFTAATSLTRSQPNFARSLSVYWAGTLYIHFGAPLRNFATCKIHFASKFFLRSPILAALLHGTRAVGVSQALRRSAEGATYIRQGGHHVGHPPTFYS